MKVFVIVPAAGLGTRMAPPSDAMSPEKKAPSKQFKELDGVPILVHAAQVRRHPDGLR
jgi:2-C-methyl-D-erythritol 4-phosphate cytidylyltransferase